MTFENEICDVINRSNQESLSNTPDFILAAYLTECLNAFDIATRRRTKWYGGKPDSDRDALEAILAIEEDSEAALGAAKIIAQEAIRPVQGGLTHD